MRTPDERRLCQLDLEIGRGRWRKLGLRLQHGFSMLLANTTDHASEPLPLPDTSNLLRQVRHTFPLQQGQTCTANVPANTSQPPGVAHRLCQAPTTRTPNLIQRSDQFLNNMICGCQLLLGTTEVIAHVR
ncbi:hypothetical protein D9M68_906370 [compost metagenome]